MFEFFRKEEELSKIFTNNINTSDKKRLNTLLFSPELLFLAKKGLFDFHSLNSISDHITNPDVDKFISSYIYIITNKFPEDGILHGSSYKSFEAILGDAIYTLSYCNDHKEIQELSKIIHILLLNPSIDLSNKFSINEGAPKLAIDHIFSIWLSCDNNDKKKIISDLLTHLIAITPNLTSITPNPRMHCAYALLTLTAYYAISRCLSSNNLFSKIFFFFDIIHMALYISAAVSLGYLLALNKINNDQSKEIDNKLCIDPSYLIGSFSVNLPFVLKASSILSRLNDKIVATKSESNGTYFDSYIKRKLLIAKFTAFRSFRNAARFDIKFQLNIFELQKYYNSLIKPNNAILVGEKMDTFTSLIKQIFHEENFNSLIQELKHDNKREYFLKFYEIVEKGFIDLDLEIYYVINEVFNQICFKSYNSILLKADNKNSDSSHTFDDLQSTIPLGKLNDLWKNIRAEFDAQCKTPDAKIDHPSKRSPTPIDQNLDDISTQFSQIFHKYIINLWNDNKDLISLLKFISYVAAFTTGALIAIRSTFIQTSLLAMVCYSVNYYWSPQSINIKEIGLKFYADACYTGNQLYCRIDPMVKSWKSSISSYIVSKNLPASDAGIHKRE